MSFLTVCQKNLRYFVYFKLYLIKKERKQWKEGFNILTSIRNMIYKNYNQFLIKANDLLNLMKNYQEFNTADPKIAKMWILSYRSFTSVWLLRYTYKCSPSTSSSPEVISNRSRPSRKESLKFNWAQWFIGLWWFWLVSFR